MLIIYKTTNLITGKYYIGQHTLDNPKYLGSGKYLKNAINKYGKENFVREILCECKTLSELNSMEEYWIEELDATNPEKGYNLSKSYSFNYGMYKESNPKKYQEICNKRSMSMMGKNKRKHTLEQNENHSIKMTGKKQSVSQIENHRKSMIGKPSPLKGTHQSQETKDNRSKSMIGKNKGQKRTQEFCNNISKKLTGHKQSEYTIKLRILKRQLFYANKNNNLATIIQLEEEIRIHKLTNDEYDKEVII